MTTSTHGPALVSLLLGALTCVGCGWKTGVDLFDDGGAPLLSDGSIGRDAGRFDAGRFDAGRFDAGRFDAGQRQDAGEMMCTPDELDNDNDGVVDVRCGGEDCDDGDPRVRPGVRETCDDGLDNNCDERIDCADPGCRGSDACPPCLVREMSCSDGLDEDCDGAPDCADVDCRTTPMCMPGRDAGLTRPDAGRRDAGGPISFDAGARRDGGRDAGPPRRDAGFSRPDAGRRDGGGVCSSSERTLSDCTDGRDNDCDGRFDCDDPECVSFGPGSECCNGADDDGDGLVDVFACRCFSNAECAGIGDLEQVCWTSTFSLCAPRCNFVGGDAFCREFLGEDSRCNIMTGECIDTGGGPGEPPPPP